MYYWYCADSVYLLKNLIQHNAMPCSCTVNWWGIGATVHKGSSPTTKDQQHKEHWQQCKDTTTADCVSTIVKQKRACVIIKYRALIY